MSDYQEGSGPYRETPGAGGSQYHEPESYQGNPGQQGAPPSYQGSPQYDTGQFQGGGQQQWAGGQPGPHGQGSQGFFQGGHPSQSRGGLRHIRSTFKTTEFWVYIVAVIAILIASAVTDESVDNQGFGAQDAWKYITWLSVAYIISRGLTKLAGHEPDRDHDDDDRRGR
jgi:hypothetical protein